MLIILSTLNSQSDHSKTSTISESGSDACFISSDCVFFLPFSKHSNYLQATHDQIIGTEVSRSLV